MCVDGGERGEERGEGERERERIQDYNIKCVSFHGLRF